LELLSTHSHALERTGIMAGQEQQRRPLRRQGEDAPPEATAPAAQARDPKRDEEVDDLLAEIDGVLEANAEEFVHGFVQKGGQ
jgi:ubiquitin-like protein Pup